MKNRVKGGAPVYNIVKAVQSRNNVWIQVQLTNFFNRNFHLSYVQKIQSSNSGDIFCSKICQWLEVGPELKNIFQDWDMFM